MGGFERKLARRIVLIMNCMVWQSLIPLDQGWTVEIEQGKEEDVTLKFCFEM